MGLPGPFVRALVAAETFVALAAGLARAQEAAPAKPGLRWDARAVEHLYNRAAFGARPEEVEEGLALGPEALVDKLMSAARPWQDVEPVLIRWEDFDLGPDQIPLAKSKYATPEEASQNMSRLRALDRAQFVDYSDRWFAAMIAHDDPLRDRMTLFWHGLFTTSLEVVKRKYELIEQHQWLRRGALGSYAELLHGIVHDPAMLQYLDNNTNVRGHPNENLARELMELYSLGEGHYTEVDVREAARALTGCTGDAEGHYAFVPERHDDGEKTILGVTGKLGSDELVEVLLAQPACARYLARKLITWFEGVEPSPERLESYAAFLRESHYELKPFLRRLFLDPAFYRDEVVGARVQGPIEFLVGFCRRTRLEPPSRFLFYATALLGQRFYAPPTVKGWDEGLAWITNDSLMQRGNCAGVMLGVLTGDALEEAALRTSDPARAPMPASMPVASGGMRSPAESPGALASNGASSRGAREAMNAIVLRLSRLTDQTTWEPNLDLVGFFAAAGAKTDAEIVDRALREWLAIEPPAATRALLASYLARERESAGLPETELAQYGERNEIVLRRLARMVFSLPEAQLE